MLERRHLPSLQLTHNPFPERRMCGEVFKIADVQDESRCLVVVVVAIQAVLVYERLRRGAIPRLKFSLDNIYDAAGYKQCHKSNERLCSPAFHFWSAVA
jgi:hypothetical protein